MSDIDPARLLDDLNALRSFGRQGSGVERRAYAAPDTQARHWLLGRMQDAGLDAHIDGIGNIHGRCSAPRAILTGSHVDTVPSGGWLDGAYGVIVALEVARVLNDRGRPTDLGVDIVAFADEEGRFRGTMGSRAFCGQLPEAEIQEAVDGDGVRLVDALAESGWAGRPIDRLDPGRHVAFLEAHIEQGPVLERTGDQVGVVTGIVGIRRIAVTFHGRPDHAGATPMPMRRDAGAAAVDFAASFAKEMARRALENTVWNVGALELKPGFGNIVPDRADLVIEYRDLSNDLLVDIDQAVVDLAVEIDGRHRVTHTMNTVASEPPLETDPALTKVLARAAENHAVRHRAMPSGAGHDAMIVGGHIPTAMLFAPSIGGRSHCDAEDTRADDLVRTAEVFTTAIAELLQTL